MAVKKETKIIHCNGCDKDRTEKDYYKSYGSTASGLLPLCKHCCTHNGLDVDGSIDLEKFKKLLMQVDRPYIHSLFVSNMNKYDKVISAIGYYFKDLGMVQNRSLRYKDSDVDKKIDSKILNNNECLFDKEIVNRWGKGFDKEALEFLEEDYHEWTTHNDCSKLSVQRLVQMICIKEWEIRKARQSGEPTDKLEKALLTLMDNSSLTPKTMSAINETDSAKIYGVWIRDIEKYRPAEYFDKKDLYRDHDGILEYFNRYILRPLKNLLTGSRDFDKEFNVEDEEIEDELLEEDK